MSDNNGQTAAEQSESAAADPHAVNEPEANGPEQRPAAANRRTVSAGIARLALVLALAAAVMSGWHWYAGQQDSAPPVGETDEFRSLQTELNGIIERVERLGVQINDLSRQSASLAAAAEDTEITLAGMRDRLAALEESESRRSDRIAQLERRVEEAVERLDEAAGDRRQADREVARRIELHEVSGLLRLGQARAELAGDFASARRAYARAADQLRQIEDPRLERARGLLAREAEALAVIREPGWAELAARLSQLAAESDRWDAAGATRTDPAAEPAESGSDGWLARAGHSLGKLVRVERRDGLPPSKEILDGLRERVRLRLLAAELAISRRSMSEFRHHAARAIAVMEASFDTDSESVRRVIEVLGEVADLQPPEPPELGQALAEINRYLASS